MGTACFILIDLGLFDALAMQLQVISEYLSVPASGLPIIAAQFASCSIYDCRQHADRWDPEQ